MDRRRKYRTADVRESPRTVRYPTAVHVPGRNKNRYLTVCYNEETGEYVAARITDAKLLDMLQNIETMYDTFRDADEIALIRYIPGKNGYIWNNMNQECISDEMLPDKGEYFGLRNEKIRNFVAKLSRDVPDK